MLKTIENIARVIFSRPYHYLNWLRCKHKSILKNNKQFKNQGRGKRAFVIATGPSIKNEDLKVLAGEDVYTVSNFFLHKDINIIRPKIHFFAPYHPPLIKNNFIDWLANGDKKLPSTTDVFLGISDYELINNANLFPNRKKHYMMLGGTNYKKNNIAKYTPAARTGVHMILNLLVYMNYDEIFLLGCDCNVLKNYGSQIENFYSAEQEIRKNATDKTVWDNNMVNRFKSEIQTHIAYEKYNSYRPKIINLSEESWLQMFPKAKLKNIIKN